LDGLCSDLLRQSRRLNNTTLQDSNNNLDDDPEEEVYLGLEGKPFEFKDLDWSESSDSRSAEGSIVVELEEFSNRSGAWTQLFLIPG
jgi:hypothetical protein